jgi:hypothetical protein
MTSGGLPGGPGSSVGHAPPAGEAGARAVPHRRRPNPHWRGLVRDRRRDSRPGRLGVGDAIGYGRQPRAGRGRRTGAAGAPEPAGRPAGGRRQAVDRQRLRGRCRGTGARHPHRAGPLPVRPGRGLLSLAGPDPAGGFVGAAGPATGRAGHRARRGGNRRRRRHGAGRQRGRPAALRRPGRGGAVQPQPPGPLHRRRHRAAEGRRRRRPAPPAERRHRDHRAADAATCTEDVLELADDCDVLLLGADRPPRYASGPTAPA